MTTREQTNKDLIQRAYAALNDQDRERFADLVAADAVHHTPQPLPEHHGHEEYVNGEFGVFDSYPDTSYEIDTIVAEDDKVAIRVIWRGTAQGEAEGVKVQGAEVETTINEIYRIENEKIVETWTETDLLTQAHQLGIVNDLKVRNQYLEVLNRVLRHNLRNGLGSIRGYAEVIAEQIDDPTPAVTIQETADRLVTLAEKARALQADTIDKELEQREIDVPAVLQAAIDNVEAVEAANITVEADQDNLQVTTDPTLFETALVELMENAVVHNDAEHPWIEVTASVSGTDPRTVSVAVADTGPGIPANEIEPIEQEAEDPLIHGSSIGLWAVKWTVDRLDGELVFDDNDPRGSVVTVQIPDLKEEK